MVKKKQERRDTNHIEKYPDADEDTIKWGESWRAKHPDWCGEGSKKLNVCAPAKATLVLLTDMGPKSVKEFKKI